jgi:hypothetical protein
MSRVARVNHLVVGEDNTRGELIGINSLGVTVQAVDADMASRTGAKPTHVRNAPPAAAMVPIKANTRSTRDRK